MLPVSEIEFPEIVNLGKPIVALVSAAWCKPCQQLKPTIKKLEEVYKDRVAFLSIDSDSCQALCGQLHVSAIPTLLFIVGSALPDRLVGLQPENKIKEKIESILE